MNNDTEEKKNGEAHEWPVNLLPIVSTFIGGGALWYAWFKYSDYINHPDIGWHQWIQPCLILLLGIICLSATLVFIKNKSSGWRLLGIGLSLIPIVLLLNLFIFVIGLIAKGFGYAGEVIRGAEESPWEKMSDFPEAIFSMSPINLILQAIIILLVIVSVTWKMKKKRSGIKDEE